MTDNKSHLYEEKYNNQGCLMKIVKYSKNSDITVEFQDEHRARVNTQYCNFCKGSVKNPYYPVVYSVGIVGDKYITVDENSKSTKEYAIWYHILQRCFDEKWKEKRPWYKDTKCCDEWLYYPNFYEWLHSQPNFDKWYKGKRWAIDKDILFKGNKVYSPEACCLVPQNVNCLFVKRKAQRGDLPIGVKKSGEKFEANCGNPISKKGDFLGRYININDAFNAYKEHKENLIKQIAQIEYNTGNITEKCYKAMLDYVVEIND